MSGVSTFTDEIADIICERIANGESLKAICEDEDMPDKSTVFRWLAAEDNKSFRDKYALARETQADALFDDILSIADDGKNDWMERRGEEDPGWVANGENLRRSQLRIDARKWMAGKLRPKKYGEKLDINLDGSVNFAISSEPVSEEQWLKENGSTD